MGNGPNRIAANEVRIKLSELCYKSIACDATEDKKHIDLSSEPMILVCAAGLSGSTADDVAKEIAIYRAHKAAPVVIASEGEERFSAAMQAVLVPPDPPEPGLRAVGHGRPPVQLRGGAGHRRPGPSPARGAGRHRGGGVVGRPTTPTDLLDRLGLTLEPMAARFFDVLRAGDYDGHLEASTAVRLASQLRYALGVVPLDVVPGRARQGRHARAW